MLLAAIWGGMGLILFFAPRLLFFALCTFAFGWLWFSIKSFLNELDRQTRAHLEVVADYLDQTERDGRTLEWMDRYLGCSDSELRSMDFDGATVYIPGKRESLKDGYYPDQFLRSGFSEEEFRPALAAARQEISERSRKRICPEEPLILKWWRVSMALFVIGQ